MLQCVQEMLVAIIFVQCNSVDGIIWVCHNAAREPHAALACHWSGSRKIPLIMFGF